MNIPLKIAEELQITEQQVTAAVSLLDEGCTVPFIARYRKEVTGSLNDEQLRKLNERLSYLRNLDERRAAVLKSISEQGKLTDELAKKIDAAETLVALEDLYRPYKQKRRTRASIARERGLEPLAVTILQQKLDHSALEEAAAYLNPENGVETPEQALAGASDIIAEQVADSALFRTWIRNRTRAYGILTSVAKEKKEQSVYETYYDFESPVEKMTGYRVLAINRGEKEKILNVRINAPEEDILRYLKRRIIRDGNPFTEDILSAAIEDAYHRLIAPSSET